MRLTDPEEARLLDYLLAHSRARRLLWPDTGRPPGAKPIRYFGRCSGCGAYVRWEERGAGRSCEGCLKRG